MKLKVLIQPNAKKSEAIGLHDGAVKIKIKAPPVDGAANEALIAFISKTLSIPKKNVTILHGHTGRNKLLEIDYDANVDDVIRLLCQDR
ncbi:DUF167 domain-containing protein [Pseudobdellovibrio exovorus]|uniref:UPF0235 protein A11Q_525 n=1 Tax=Pseudobdellovibrio exovorus JSS TaxID=1184267 RepID=M4V8F6_9BACT|nr:DUF167 domain-containing protein [Pseudobdellovibrio exovorus]AGH94745.1 hypothetical protein A11Q_525 [Pseudobdellovibrio exovorus JSS]